MVKIGIVDTMFARVNMGDMAIDEIEKNYSDVELVRRTVPGVKDLPVECKKLLDEDCDSCMALGMVGGAPIDTQCAHEASLGIQQAKLMTNKHIIEVFVHENEAWSEKELQEIFENRVRKHAHNAVLIVTDPEKLVADAGKGVRQGKEDEGALETGEKRLRFGIVVSEFNSELTGEMAGAAKEYAEEVGVEIVERIVVSGAFDIPLAAKKLLMDKKVDGVITLGAIVQGETKHDEVIGFSLGNALTKLSLEFKKPVTLGVIGPGAGWDDAEERTTEYAKRAIDAAIKLCEELKA